MLKLNERKLATKIFFLTTFQMKVLPPNTANQMLKHSEVSA